MATTIRDIANRLHLSHTTVSRVLNKKDDLFISETTRERVVAAAREMGYRPNLAARALVTGRTRAVTLWTSESFTPYYALVARHASQQAIQRHYHLTVHSAASLSGLSEHETALLDRNVDGAIFCDIRADLLDVRIPLPSEETPIVHMGIYPVAEVDSVEIDLYSGAVEAVRHLIESGYRRIAYLVNGSTYQVGDPRNQGYATAMQQAGYAPEVIPIPSQQRAEARAGIANYIRAHGCPRAIFCVNDEVAIGCYRGLCDLGLRIPQEVALVGCDGLEDTAYHYHPISTLVLPVEAMCQLAWELLEQRIQNPDRPRQKTILSPKLVIRESSRPAE